VVFGAYEGEGCQSFCDSENATSIIQILVNDEKFGTWRVRPTW